MRVNHRILLMFATIAAAVGLTLVTTPQSASAAPAPGTTARATAAAKTPPMRVIAIKAAKAVKGKPYRRGANGPDAFDCSGLTQYAYRAAGRTLPRVSRDQVAATKRISRAKARRGDLVFFRNGGRVYHVGLYAGRNRVLHSPRTGAKVRTEKIWTKSVTFGRVRR